MDIYKEYLDLARLALSGRHEDVIALLRRAVRRSKSSQPELNLKLGEALESAHKNGSVQRRTAFRETFGTEAYRQDTKYVTRSNPNSVDAIWPASVARELNALISEQAQAPKLERIGMLPTRTVLFIGPPGVGKTMAASWLSERLHRTLLTVDLATLMSSRLGETGSNLSNVLKKGANSSSILLLDEFDSVGKRRDDDTDVGELKRLVNVLLQALDRWPPNGIFVAATNHPELLDRAVWRRFDSVVKFPMPDTDEIHALVSRILKTANLQTTNDVVKLISESLDGKSFAEVDKIIKTSVRRSVVNGTDPARDLAETAACHFRNGEFDSRLDAARTLTRIGFSQRSVAAMLEMSRDTIRKHSQIKVEE